MGAGDVEEVGDVLYPDDRARRSPPRPSPSENAALGIDVFFRDQHRVAHPQRKSGWVSPSTQGSASEGQPRLCWKSAKLPAARTRRGWSKGVGWSRATRAARRCAQAGRRGAGRRRGRAPAGCARDGAPPARSPRARSSRVKNRSRRFAARARRRSLRRRRDARGRALRRRGRSARARAPPLPGAGRWNRESPSGPRARRRRRTSPWGRPELRPRCGRRGCTRRTARGARAGRRGPAYRW